MTFRVALWWGLFSVVCLAFVGAVKSRPVGGEFCRIIKQGDCSCQCIQTRTTTWGSIADLYKRLFIRSFAPLNLEAECRKCEVECKRHISVNCLNGVCHEKGCECAACWKGKSCDQSANEHAPRFQQDSYKTQISDDAEPGTVVAATIAIDKDKKKCLPDAPCPCGEIIYSITSGNEAGYFTIEKHSGNIRVAKNLDSRETIVLGVAAANIDGKHTSTEMTIDVVKPKRRERRSADHHIVRRSVLQISPSGIIAITPDIPNNTFYNSGDKIKFNLTASHNQSVAVANPTANLNFKCSSAFLSVINQAALSESKPVTNWNVNNGELTFTVAALGKDEIQKVQFEVEVKANIYPLANLFLSCEATTSTHKIGPSTSSPTLYAVFPKVTLTRLTLPGASHIDVDTTLKFQMITELPALTFPLSFEITTAINDFSSMGIRNVTITQKGSNIAGAVLNPTPQNHKSSEELTHYDRVTLDFKNLTVSDGPKENSKLVFEFEIDFKDHPLLANGSKIWIGGGLSSGSNMLSVVQTAVYAKKIEPTVACTVTPKNNTVQNRYSIDDNIVVDFECSHTNTSTANAKNLILSIWSDYLEFSSASYTLPGAGSPTVATTHNDTRLNDIPQDAFNQGQTIQGTMSMKVRDTMQPLVEMNVYVKVSYKNEAGKDKMKTVHKMKQPPIAAVPVISLNITNPLSCYRVGSIIGMDFKILMRKINAPLKVEIIAPVNDSSSVIAIKSVSTPVIGTNIVDNANLQKTPINCKSTVNDTSLNDRCTLDFGTVKSIVGIANSPLNEISIPFDILLNEHAIMTNGSKHWQAVGVRGGSRMMWIGEVAIKVCSSADPKPVLKIESNCYIPDTAQTCCSGKLKKGDEVQFNITVSHDDKKSEQYAKNIKVIHMLPRYVVYEKVKLKHPSRLVFTPGMGIPQLTDSKPFRFLDQLTFSYIAKLDPAGIMKKGESTQATSIADVSYVGQDINRFFSVNTDVCAAFTTPPDASSAKPSLESTPVEGWYNRGFFLLQPSKTLIVCSESIASSSCYYTSDNGISWIAMSDQVGRVIANSKEVLYAISKNKRAYMKQAKRGDTWCSISKDQLEAELGSKLSTPSANLKVIPDDETNVADPTNFLEDADKNAYGGNKDAVFFRPKGGAWEKKAIWKCCGAS